MNKSDLKVLLVLTVSFLLLVFIYVGIGNIYGSTTDWVIQHTVFPDYFRTLFYETGNLTPNLALNLGAGQNIYYFSYYGLLNPFIVFSYLFPFIKMIDYLIITNIFIVIMSSFLVYKWLKNNDFNNKTAFVSSLLFMLINAFFHAHRHIMFVDYIPFLILGLIGIDVYFKNKKSSLYIASVFLMIMTSYYYSVGGLLCLLIYGIYKYIKINHQIKLKTFFIDGFKFLLPMFVGILMSFILLVPTIYTILESRSQINASVDISSLFIPNFNFNALLYDNYAMGFTSIALISLLYMILYKKREKRFLSTSVLLLLIVPFFMYLLNGMLYLRGKVFIPMSPLIILMVAIFLKDLQGKRMNIVTYGIVVISAIIMSIIFNYNDLVFYIDIILTSLIIVGYLLKENKYLLYIPLIIIALCINISVNKNDTYVSKKTYKELQAPILSELINIVEEQDPSFYRMDNIIGNTAITANKIYNNNYYQTSLYSSTFNPNYKNFHDNYVNNAISHRNNLMITSSNNIMFQTMMGVKYLFADDNNVPVGYTLVNSKNNYNVYKNEDVLPIGYSSSSLMNSNVFEELEYPYRAEALLRNIIVDGINTSNFESDIEPINLTYDIESTINIKQEGLKYIIETDKEEMVKIHLKEPIINKLLFIKFKLSSAPNCNDGDISITINNATNKLTCKQWLYFNNNYEFEYVISNPNEISELSIIFSSGYFEIESIETFAMDYEKIKESVSTVDEFIIDKYKTKNNIIEGNIDVTNDGYFMLTIPYDKGFTLYVDGEKRQYKKVNKAFIGFPITEGSHHIKLEYKSPGYDAGLLGSFIGWCLYIGIIIAQKRKNKVKS